MTEKSIELINHELDTNGYSVMEPSVNGFKKLDIIKNRFKSCSPQEFNNPYKPKIFSNLCLTKNINPDLEAFNDFCLRKITLMGRKENCLSNIYQTVDTPNSEHLAQKPHFDRIPTLKFMLYANNLSADSGAFCLSSGSHIWTKEKFRLSRNRPAHDAKGFLEVTRQIPTNILDNLIPIEGPEGTIIIFDTDCIHHQGIVKTGEAHIIRSHYRVKDDKRNSGKIYSVKKFIKNFISKSSKR